jgi:hypothetical protein
MRSYGSKKPFTPSPGTTARFLMDRTRVTLMDDDKGCGNGWLARIANPVLSGTRVDRAGVVEW